MFLDNIAFSVAGQDVQTVVFFHVSLRLNEYSTTLPTSKPRIIVHQVHFERMYECAPMHNFLKTQESAHSVRLKM